MGRICIFCPPTPKFLCVPEENKSLQKCILDTVCYFTNLFCRLAKIKEWIDTNDNGAVIIPLSGALESKVTINSSV